MHHAYELSTLNDEVQMARIIESKVQQDCKRFALDHKSLRRSLGIKILNNLWVEGILANVYKKGELWWME